MSEPGLSLQKTPSDVSRDPEGASSTSMADQDPYLLRRRIKNAQVEIDRCNIEARRLLTAIHDETQLFANVIAELRASNALIFGAVRDFVMRRNATNAQIIRRLHQIHNLKGFTVTLLPEWPSGAHHPAPSKQLQPPHPHSLKTQTSR